MEPITLLFIFTSSFFTQALSANPCKPDSCDTAFGPVVRFPFLLKNRQPAHCGYPGFDLYCNNENQTILNLPESGEFVVDHIDYTEQAIFINDPDSCLGGRILNFSLSGSPFQDALMSNYTLLNCSSDYIEYTGTHYVPLYCLSGRNFTVLATLRSASAPPPTCRRIASVLAPLRWRHSQYYWSAMDMREDLQLIWTEPACRKCENQGGICGFTDESSREIGCFMPAKSGLPRGAKYGIIIGVGVPGLVCVIGLACYACGMIRAINLRRSVSSGLPTTIPDHRPTIRSASGLDRPTIESYPITVLGESRRLPNLSDGTCPICLSDYQPKEMLRSIPECNHYFHADCIDEWLKLNGTCPLCRNSPESSVATPSSSMSVSSSHSSLTTLNPR